MQPQMLACTLANVSAPASRWDARPSPRAQQRTEAATNARRVARGIMAATHDGDDIWQFAWLIMRAGGSGELSKKAGDRLIADYGVSFVNITMQDKQWAVETLLNRGVGKAIEAVHLSVDGPEQPDDELIAALIRTLPAERLRTEAARIEQAKPGQRVLDTVPAGAASSVPK